MHGTTSSGKHLYLPLAQTRSENDEPGDHEDVDSERELVNLRRTVKIYRHALWLMLFLTAAILGTFQFVQLSMSQTSLLHSDKMFPHGSFENHLVTFAKGNEFEHSLPDTEGSAWNRLLPAGNFGFIQVQDPLRFNVTDGLPFDPHEYQMRPAWHFAERAPGNRTEIFVLSMYHQMHCLIMMRKMFMTMSPEGKVVAGMSPAEDISNGHLNHCFDYLRQAILCAGDTALDHYAWDETGPEPVYGVNGWGATHVCRKLDKIEEFVNENGWYRGRVEQSRVSTS